MSEAGEGGSPRGALTEQRNTDHEAEQPANEFALLVQDQRGERERSHEEMVAIIRKDMAAYIAKKKPYQFDPVAWMRERFISAKTDLLLAENPELADAARYEKPHAQLLMAWDVISQPYYKSAYHRGLVESTVKTDARHLGHTITLDPNESKLLAAMAEAVGVPNSFRQMTPEKQASK